ncbi:hypothetical protein [Bacteroides sp.]|uniref:hypothetical protein n=1 Tax=Bacteroides sp. TaxID=29523 RepID=UPI0026219411|nr:hypothetical protein [Bacteroides sp.]
MNKLIIFFLLATLFILSACEKTSVTEGRIAYKEYFKETLKDPESLIIHSEEIINKSDANARFVLNIGAKNSFGVMVQSTYTIETLGKRVLDVKEYDIRTIPKENMTFKYKEKNINTDIPITNENYAGKNIKLADDALAVVDDENYISSLRFLINFAKDHKDDIDNFNMYMKAGKGIIIHAGEEITITECFIYFNEDTKQNENLFRIKYKGEPHVIEQSAIF